MSPTPDLILASASPRRRELLQTLGLVLAVEPVDIDETAREGEPVRDYVVRMAAEKCDAAVARREPPDLAVLAADTIVSIGNEILGKPADEAQASTMLQRLAGHRHEVLTAYRIRLGERTVERLVTTFVNFRAIDAREVAAYLASGEWRGKAGAYAIQGIAGCFVTDVRGSFTNVVGLPVAEVIADLRAIPGLAQLSTNRLRSLAVTRDAQIAANLQAVNGRVRAALLTAGRAPKTLCLLAVSKTVPAEDVVAALAVGQVDFAESYGQEFRDKQAAVAKLVAATPGLPSPRWHFIGPLQSNKVKYVAGKVALIHSVGSLEVLAAIAGKAAGLGVVQDCLVQVNVAGETQKSGIAPADLPATLEAFAAYAHVRCTGLMVIPPYDARPELSRPHFAALRRLRDEQRTAIRPNVALTDLSMGMSHDLEVALAEGATLIRVGTAIFGART